MKVEEFIRLNIAFKPPDQICEYAINLSRSLREDSKTFFILNGKNILPHITIYSPEFPSKNIDRIYQEIEKVVKDSSTIEFKFKKIESDMGFVGVEFELTKNILEIHEEILKSLNSLREGCLKMKYKDPKYVSKLSSEEKDNIQRYGYPSVLSLYKPHLSIIRFQEDKEAEEVAKELDWKYEKFLVEEIVVYRMGEHGTCKEELKSVKLK